MNKCKFCEHYACNDRKEGVCKKYLFWLGDDDLPSCEGFSINIRTRYAVRLLLLTVVVVTFLILAL